MSLEEIAKNNNLKIEMLETYLNNIIYKLSNIYNISILEKLVELKEDK